MNEQSHESLLLVPLLAEAHRFTMVGFVEVLAAFRRDQDERLIAEFRDLFGRSMGDPWALRPPNGRFWAHHAAHFRRLQDTAGQSKTLVITGVSAISPESGRRESNPRSQLGNLNVLVSCHDGGVGAQYGECLFLGSANSSHANVEFARGGLERKRYLPTEAEAQGENLLL